MTKVLLINPSYRDSYGSSKAAIVNPIFPTLGILTIAAAARECGHSVEVLDLSHRQYDYRLVEEAVRGQAPDFVGITATTPLMNQVRDISVLVKSISEEIQVVAGGSHVSALPAESLKESMLDAVAVGEGDLTFPQMLDGNYAETPGLCYRKDQEIFSSGARPFVSDLDSLPFPAWELFDPAEYESRVSRIQARYPPLTSAEFSRGCVFKCDFCASKITMALGYRKKSPERCAEEVRMMAGHGFREFALSDDIFTSDGRWAKAVCEAILRSDVQMPWTCTNGIRVESADEELFRLLRRSGCYRVSFGFETGNAEVLRAFGKGGKASLERGREAAKMARAAGLEVNGFFMLGLSADTEESMNDTITFARSLPLDSMKFGIAIGFPGTPMFRENRDGGRIRSYDWDDYFIYTSEPLFAHKNLTHATVRRFMARAYREAILLNPSFILRRFAHGVRTLGLLRDGYYFLRYLNSPSMSSSTGTANYFARDRWPVFDFENEEIELGEARMAASG